MITSNGSAVKPSMLSLGFGGSRTAEARPIRRGAIVMMPSASEANLGQTVGKGRYAEHCIGTRRSHMQRAPAGEL